MRPIHMKLLSLVMALLGLCGIVLGAKDITWAFVVSAIWSVGAEICQRLER